jgi:small subunit ribosomal protein S6
MNIEAEPHVVAEMERRMGLSQDVLRFLTLRVEAHENDPSVQMRKGDDRRDGERGAGRGPRPPRAEGASTFRARPGGRREQAESEE